MTWTDVAQVTGFRWCGGGCGADEAAHYTGYVIGNTIHWTDRGVTKRGIRHFLMLAGDAAIGDVDVPLWQRIWSLNDYVTKRARDLRLRIPRKYAESDRLTVRYLLSRDKRGDAVTRKQARTWAQD